MKRHLEGVAMESHWEKFETIRVVDAGYLLAGLEPERKWQFAPPLVKNFFNLIRDKTGAVKLATMPGERMEITKAEFQALKAEYGVRPAMEPAPATPNDDVENIEEREFLAAFSESVHNGEPINWRYWVRQLPTLTTAEAARLMCGLDPDLFKDLESRPNKNDPSRMCRKAAMIQRLAEREGKESARPDEWITWADEHQIAVHDGFRLEVESAPATDNAKPAPVVAGGKKWTPERLAELKAYREAHTMPETADKFGISQQRIRDLLPSKKAKATPFAGLGSRQK